MLQNVDSSDLLPNLSVLTHLLTFGLGVLISRFTLSKAERISAGNAAFALTKELVAQQQQAKQKLYQTLSEFGARTGKPTLQEFYEVISAASAYLTQQKIIADAILSNKVDTVSRDGTLVPSLIECAEKTLPSIYDALKDIAENNGLPYPDSFERENYKSIFDVVEKYSPRKNTKDTAQSSEPLAEN